MLTLVPASVAVVVTIVLAAAAVAARALTPAAGAVAAAFGCVIVVLAGYPFLALLILFVVGSALATRYRLEEKRARNLQEGRSGERGVSNVLAHIVIPTGLVVGAILSPFVLPFPTLAILYSCALAFGASDTFASEFGVLAGEARSIVSGKPVPAGTNGGITGLGELFALFGAGSTAAVALALFTLWGEGPGNGPLFFVTATAAGFVACQVDSVLGETLENRGLLTKGTTNFFAMLSAVGIGALVVALTGASL